MGADLLVRVLFGCGVTWGCGVNSVRGERVAQGVEESGTNRGRLRDQVLLIGCVREAGVPASVVVGEGVVEDAGADLE